ncbi:hypothetical protein FACS189449_06220 [Alphaproteobacteria bacterium]|nr:hypothetical protein FACS189449_06220 [Alphaproteobacteria bacterium]
MRKKWNILNYRRSKRNFIGHQAKLRVQNVRTERKCGEESDYELQMKEEIQKFEAFGMVIVGT